MLSIRNIGIMAHVDAGKTTCAERILFLAGRIRAKGEVHDGNTTLDFLKLERQKGITIQAAATAVEHNNHRIQLIDTPGHIDFTIEVERSLRVLDGAVFVLDAASGVECQSETVFRQAARHGVPCLAFVNKIDKPGADFEACLRDIEERLEIRPLPIVIPGPGRTTIDVVRRALVVDEDGGKRRDLRPIPEGLRDEVEQTRRKLVEICADQDDEVMNAFVSGLDVSADALDRALRKATLERAGLVVLAGAALQDIGIGSLLDAVVAYLPSPMERKSIPGNDLSTGEAIERRPLPGEPFTALAFKSTFDRNAGLVTWLRVYAGRMRTGDSVVTASNQRSIRIGRLYRPDGAQTHPTEEAGPGDVVCVHGLGQIRTGETLSDPKHPIALESIEVPDPVVSIVIEPKTAGDRDKLGLVLGRILACDPSLRSAVDPETGQTVLSGMGRLHLEIAVTTLDELGVALKTGMPKVAYRSTITRSATVSYRHKKQSGGPGQFAGVTIAIEPAPRGSGIAFTDETRGGAIPREWVTCIEHGVRRAAEVREPPAVDIHVRLLDGETHVKDSSGIAFELAASAAFQEALTKADAVTLEPVAVVEVTAPEPSAGDVLGDLAARRALVRDVTPRGKDRVVVVARLPLAATFDYVPRLRALTHGRGEATVTPDGYEVAV